MLKSQAKETQHPVALTLTQAHTQAAKVSKAGSPCTGRALPAPKSECQGLKKCRARHKMGSSLAVLIQPFKD